MAEEAVKEDRTPEEMTIDGIDNAIDNLLATLESLKKQLIAFQPQTVPGRAAKDNIMETIETALEPYLADVVTDVENLA